MCTSPVPASIATKSSVSTTESRAIHGWRACVPTSAAPGSARAAARARPATPGRFATATASGRATISHSPSTSRAVYVSVGCTAMARFAGKVQGVVVQMTSDALRPPRASARAGLAVATGNFTYTVGEVSSSYSTSAWASAVLQCMHQCTGLRPL